MELIYEPAALNGLDGMPKADAKRMEGALQQIADLHPQRMGYVTGMQGQAGYWRARKGTWRAVHRQTETAIVVVSIASRGRAYK